MRRRLQKNGLPSQWLKVCLQVLGNSSERWLILWQAGLTACLWHCCLQLPWRSFCRVASTILPPHPAGSHHRHRRPESAGPGACAAPLTTVSLEPPLQQQPKAHSHCPALYTAAAQLYGGVETPLSLRAVRGEGSCYFACSASCIYCTEQVYWCEIENGLFMKKKKYCRAASSFYPLFHAPARAADPSAELCSVLC